MNKKRVQWLITLILCFFFGTFGIHRFYNKKIKTGILQILTIGGLGIWVLIDLVLILLNKFKINEKGQTGLTAENIEKSEKDWLITFALCWTLGIIGAHRFYNKKIGTGILQLLTFGGLGIWALVDLINISRHKFLDKENNIVIKRTHESYKFIITVFIFILLISSVYSIYSLNNTKVLVETVKERLDEYHINQEAMFELLFSKTVGMEVFMEFDITDEQIVDLHDNLNKINGVYKVTFISKEEAYNTMKKKLGKNEKVLSNFTPDIFSASFLVETSTKNEDKVYDKIIKLPGVREINSSSETRDELKRDINYIILILLIDNYKYIIIYSIILLIIRTAISIYILGSVYKNKNELTVD